MEEFSLEHTVVAAILDQGQSPNGCISLKVFESIEPELFDDADCRLAYKHARAHAQRGKSWDLTALFDELGADRISRILQLSKQGTPEITIRDGVTSMCERDYRKRAGKILERYVSARDPKEALDELEGVQRIQPFQKELNLGDEYVDHIAKFHGEGHFVQTGISPIDKHFSGFMGGELVILGARPGTGKSALMLQIALNLLERGERFAFITLEMSKGSMCSRMGSSYTGTNIEKPMIKEHQDKAAGFANVLKGTDSVFMTETRTVAQLATAVRRAGKFKVLFVDYLQLLQDFGYQKQGRTQEVSAISRDLKLLAMDMDIPIVCACQLNRLAEQRSDKRPKLSDLRESGAIEQDADQVILLHDPSKSAAPNQPTSTDRMELIIAKNRRGPVGQITLRYQKDAQRITPYEYRMG